MTGGMTYGNDAPSGDHADVLGHLLAQSDDEERSRADTHLAACAECREERESLRVWSDALAAVPDPMWFDGLPVGGDLLLQRVLRRVRNEAVGFRRRRTSLTSAAAAVTALAAFGAGTLINSDDVAGVPLAQHASSLPGTRHAEAVDSATGARMSLAVAPAAGWVRVHALVSGIPAGERCRLELIGKDGGTRLAGSWMVSAAGAAEGTSLDGSALVDPADVAGARVVNEAGRTFIRVIV